MGTISVSLDGYYVDDPEGIKKYGVIAKAVKFDTVKKTTSLKKAATRYFKNNKAKETSVTVNAYDLYEMGLTPEQFKEGNTYLITCKELNYSERHLLTKITRDINETWNVTLEFGNNANSIKSLVAKNKNVNYMNIQEGE